MCLGINYIHAGCNHAKSFNVVEACDSANGTGTTCNNPAVTHVSMVTAPALCVDCFRQKEAKIDATYEGFKRDLQAEIARIDAMITKDHVRIEDSLEALEEYRAECENDIVQAKATRDVSIRLFRESQGVWGDG